MREAYIKAVADSIRAQAGNLANFVENNPARTQKEDLYANIFLAFTGIMGAVLHLEIPIYDFYDILNQIFREDTGFEVLAKLEQWNDDYKRNAKDINAPSKEGVSNLG